MQNDEGWLTHLFAGVESQSEIPSANHLHLKGKAKAEHPRLYITNRNLVKECDCMKKKTLSVLLFVITFIATYTILCFALPGAKMALGTTTLDRIWVAITCMALFKVVVSLVVASIVGVLPMIVGKRE